MIVIVGGAAADCSRLYIVRTQVEVDIDDDRVVVMMMVLILLLLLPYLPTTFVASAPTLPATTDSLMSTTLQQFIHFHEHTTDRCKGVYCPSASSDDSGDALTYRCIEKEQLCDRRPDCEHGEDETLLMCMFYKPLHNEMLQMRALIHAGLERKLRSADYKSPSL